MNPTIIFAHWVICRLSNSQICMTSVLFSK